MTKTISLTLTLLAVSAVALGQPADTVGVILPDINERIAIHSQLMWQMAPQPYGNPALNQWRLPISYSSIGPRYHHDSQNRAIDVQNGDGLDYWTIEADSYIKYKTSTLSGHAAYSNGHQRGVNWNESSDADMVYPYFLADSIGGDIQMETYSFAGGYADHTDRWAWGATLSYNAGLYYRNVDPRPRNTTGRLDIAVGGAVRLGASPYRAGVSVSYRKYKQSCDLEFVNEMADTRVWHTTGLGTHYERFAGNGYNHYYNGNRWALSADVIPTDGRGIIASFGWSSFKFDHILTSLNKLPLQSATDNQIHATAGWLAPGSVHSWAATGEITHSRRTGTENIFGDPAANVYPQIGSMKMYVHTLTSGHVNALYQWNASPSTTLSAMPSVGFSRSNETYADPRRSLRLGSVDPSLLVKLSQGFGRWWRGSMSVSYTQSIATDCNIDLPFDPSIPEGLQLTDIHRYQILSKNHSLIEIKADASRAISQRYALMLSASYSHGGYTAGVRTDAFDIAVSFIF
ncbi:MAG: hypothetical protein NC111_02480 [Bacteroides sp.]|nr:hypothetical protein [Bacteroides sp.]MCM1413306.1 hypothetical protein [Bacteroides sp.]MCM1471384.1 hypothetical protein [Bacteroides sp.]